MRDFIHFRQLIFNTKYQTINFVDSARTKTARRVVVMLQVKTKICLTVLNLRVVIVVNCGGFLPVLDDLPIFQLEELLEEFRVSAGLLELFVLLFRHHHRLLYQPPALRAHVRLHHLR